MKSVLISSLLFLSLATQIKAQDQPEFHRVEIGFRLMPTFSRFNMTTSSGGNIRGDATFGMGIGGLIAFNFNKHAGIQSEIIYNNLNQKYKDQDLDRQIRVRYVNIPLLLSLNTGNANRVNLNAVFGPQLGINIGSSIHTSGSQTSDTVTAVFAAKSGDFGVAYGGGLSVSLNPTHTIRLDLGFRGVFGFINVNNTHEAPPPNTEYILDRAVISTKAGYAGLSFLF
jgi:hypothetical protein